MRDHPAYVVVPKWEGKTLEEKRENRLKALAQRDERTIGQHVEPGLARGRHDKGYVKYPIQYTPETCPGRPCGDGCDHRGAYTRVDVLLAGAVADGEQTLREPPSEVAEALRLLKTEWETSSARVLRMVEAIRMLMEATR